MSFFVEHLPENFHLVISSRTDPPLPLGRLRARAENEIRTEQLAFSEEEADCLLNEKMGLNIGTDDLSVLLERTRRVACGDLPRLLSPCSRGISISLPYRSGQQPLHRRPPGRGGSCGSA